MYKNCFKRDYFTNNCCQPLIVNDSFRACLNGRNEIPPNNSFATGRFVVQLSSDGTRLRYTLRTNCLRNITAAHFHIGSVNENGPIVKTIPINVCTGDATGSWTASDSEPLTPQLVERLQTGGLYVNVHTTLYPGGEIRGQILPLNCQLPNGLNGSNGSNGLANNVYSPGNNVYTY